MLLSAVSVLVVAQSSSEIPERLMNNPVHLNQMTKFVVAKVYNFLSMRSSVLESIKSEHVSLSRR